MIMRYLSVFGASFLLWSCTYTSDVQPTSAAAGEIRPDRKLNYTASLYVADELATLRRQASTGYMCSAHTFDVQAGPAIVGSIRATVGESFGRLIDGGNSSAPAAGAERHIVFNNEDFQPRLTFASGFWSATAIARVNLAMRVAVYDGSGRELTRSILVGEGYAEQGGGCNAGQEALSEATTMATRRTLESFVHRIINAQVIAELAE